MQDYIEFAERNGIVLLEAGPCQFCGANTKRGIHECLEIFNLGFPAIDYSQPENHLYRFLAVDAHTLQHSEIHGRWNNHFHLIRLHLILHYKVKWQYKLSPQLSEHLRSYKKDHPNEFLIPPDIKKRGKITTTDVLRKSTDEESCKALVKSWAEFVYSIWQTHHATVDKIAISFLKVGNEHTKP